MPVPKELVKQHGSTHLRRSLSQSSGDHSLQEDKREPGWLATKLASKRNKPFIGGFVIAALASPRKHRAFFRWFHWLEKSDRKHTDHLVAINRSYNEDCTVPTPRYNDCPPHALRLDWQPMRNEGSDI